MQHPTATTAKHLSPAERKARVEALVKGGKVSAKRAALIDFREPTARERATGQRIAERLRKRAAA